MKDTSNTLHTRAGVVLSVLRLLALPMLALLPAMAWGGVGDDLGYAVEAQATTSDGQTPLWLNANKYGLSSMEPNNGYLRASLIRPLRADSARRWGLGYGVDMAVAAKFTSTVVVQQAFLEARWLHGTLSVGSKERPMELKNNELSSGSQTLGINARPVPQVRLALDDYWVVPGTRGWLQLKGHVAYGRMTDDNWQHEFTQRQSKYADDVLFHSKAGYLRIGNEEVFCPWSLELGLEMAATFGGTSFRRQDGEMTAFPNATGLRSYWDALMPGGSEANETDYKNVEGNQLGSWLARLNYDTDTWRVSVYADHYFEDHSGMLMLDYDGYGTGEEWNTKKKRRYLLYDLKDILLGAELRFKFDRWLNGIVVEYVNTKYQSGPIYHDHTPSMSNHIGGRDNYYNHSIFTGWQHWGQVMGNPLFTSPLYNTDATIRVQNNRFQAWHLGLNGNPMERLHYRLLATYQTAYGTYDTPFTHPHHDVSLLAEARWTFPHGWSAKGAFGADMGGVLGHNYGAQLTITKRGIIKRK